MTAKGHPFAEVLELIEYSRNAAVWKRVKGKARRRYAERGRLVTNPHTISSNMIACSLRFCGAACRATGECFLGEGHQA